MSLFGKRGDKRGRGQKSKKIVDVIYGWPIYYFPTETKSFSSRPVVVA